MEISYQNDMNYYCFYIILYCYICRDILEKQSTKHEVCTVPGIGKKMIHDDKLLNLNITFFFIINQIILQ